MSPTKPWENEFSRIQNCSNHYQVLNINEDSTFEDITRSYDSLSKIFSSSKCNVPEVEEGIHTIKKAYDTLRDERSRERYNRTLRENLEIEEEKQRMRDKEEVESLLNQVRIRATQLQTELPEDWKKDDNLTLNLRGDAQVLIEEEMNEPEIPEIPEVQVIDALDTDDLSTITIEDREPSSSFAEIINDSRDPDNRARENRNMSQGNVCVCCFLFAVFFLACLVVAVKVLFFRR